MATPRSTDELTVDEVTADELSADELFDALFTPSGVADPYPLLRRYRGPGARHETVRQLMRDDRFAPAPLNVPDRPFWNTFQRMLLNLDGAEHSAMRALAARPLARSRIPALGPMISEEVQRLLAGIGPGDGVIDLQGALAYPLPVAVISRVLGIPATDRGPLDGWLHDISVAFARQREEKMMARGDTAMVEFTAYLDTLLRERRAAPRDDLLSLLAEESDAPWETVLANTAFIVHAGYDTTMSAICSAIACLVGHPDALAALRVDPGLTASAVEETLRFESPVQISLRRARMDAVVDGVEFRGGEVIPIFIGAANRDPAVFAEPDRFDVTRDPNPHLAFTPGRHFCLGAPLARLEAVTAVHAVVDRFPKLALAGKPTWLGTIPLRTLDRLLVTV